jgi:hypothetical protein
LGCDAIKEVAPYNFINFINYIVDIYCGLFKLVLKAVLNKPFIWKATHELSQHFGKLDKLTYDNP